MKNIGPPLIRNQRYYRAEYWVRTRALILPGVVFTATMDVQNAGVIDCYNLSCWAEGPPEGAERPRLRYRTWCSKGDRYAPNDI